MMNSFLTTNTLDSHAAVHCSLLSNVQIGRAIAQAVSRWLPTAAALIRKFHEAKESRTDMVTLWGDGTPYREFMYSEDLAEAALYLMERKDASDLRCAAGDFINVGTGADISIKELADLIKTIVYHDVQGRKCIIEWDTTRPNGTPRKLLDVSRLKAFGFTPRHSLEEGVEKAYAYYRGERNV
jgi:GDP-L-fucose synthase